MKKKGLKIIFIFFIFAFIMGNLTVVFADEYKGHKADGPWDAFYNYFIDMWASDQSKLTTAELERFVKGPTDKEMDLLKEGRGPTHYPDDTGIKEDVMNLIQTRNKSGDNSGKLDNDAWKKKRKEVVNLYTDKIAKEKDKTKKKKLYEQLIKKVEEMDKLNSKKTLEDSDIQSMYSEAIQALKKEPTIYENQVSEKDIKNSEEKNIDKIVKEYSKVYDSISNIVNLIDIPITIKNDFDFESIIKSFKFEVNFFDNLLNNLIDLLEVKLNLSKEKIYVFINLKSYLSNEDLLELYKYIFAKNINSIFIDTNKYDDLNDNVNKIIIDTDLDEFVI